MISDITSGNAIDDGNDFSYWFVGAIEEWCKERGIPFDAGKFSLRNSDGIEIKWGIYKEGEVRKEWAERSDRTAMSILIRGELVFDFLDPEEKKPGRKVRLKAEGDYVIWKEDVLHTWRMEKDSVILTLRW
jgi:hypothetical protein